MLAHARRQTEVRSIRRPYLDLFATPDVARVSHTYAIEDLITKGRDLEKIVLATAIKHHINRKVMVFNNKTIIFY